MTAAPEFSRPYRIDTLGGQPREVSIGANEAERAALAKRFGLPALARLSAEAAITRTGESITAEGHVRAEVTQICVATGEPVQAVVDEPFRIHFRPHPETGAEEEIELREAELDVVFYDGAAVDLGEAVAETVSLALNPFPRSEKAEEALRDAGVKSEDEAKRESSPFAALQGLKDKLGGS